MLFIRTIFLIIMLSVAMTQANGPQTKSSAVLDLVNYVLALLHPKVKVIGDKEVDEYAHLFKVITDIEAKDVRGKASFRYTMNYEEEFKLGVFRVEGRVPFSESNKKILKKYRDEMGHNFFTAARIDKHILDDRAQEFATKHIGNTVGNFVNINWQEINNNNINRAARPVKIIIGLLVGSAIVSGVSYAVYKKLKARKQAKLA